MKNSLVKSSTLLARLLTISLVLTSSLFAKTTTLTVHHFLSSKDSMHTKFLIPWAKSLERASKGKLKIKIFTSMSMGGKPNELYKQVVDGSADIVWTVAGYTPGVFPRTEVYQLPTIHTNSAVATNLAIKENFHLIKDDFKKVKPLMVHVHAGNALHMVDKKVTSVSDLKGMKLRTHSRTGAWFIEALDAKPVNMSLTAFPKALSQKTIDGGFIPFELFHTFKIDKVTKYSVQGPDHTRFGTAIFLLLMNTDKFNSLSKNLQVLIKKSLNIYAVIKVGKTWMNTERPGMLMQKMSKNSEIITLSKESMDEFNKAGEKVIKRWIKEVKKKGIDGRLLVDTARNSIIENEK